jgi:NADP-dependent 3-hydroxy acid dehydrogenase YdfG
MTKRPGDGDLSGTVAVVTGATRGFGRAVATVLAEAGAAVIGIGRDRAALATLATELGDGFTPMAGDVTDAVLPAFVIDQHRPGLLVLNAGAVPPTRPVHLHTWESFSLPWEVDVRQAFSWSREALLAPLAPGSTVISISSLAAVNGSPLSGGYAGAKQTVRFINEYAAQESVRADLGIRFLSVLPMLTAATDSGARAVAGYARRQGMDVSAFREARGEMLSTEQVGGAILELAAGDADNGQAFSLTPAGLAQMS